MQLLYALILGISVGAVAGYIGTLMLTRRMALMGGALGHLTLPGVAIALIWHIDVFFGALFFLAFGILLIWFFERKTKLPFEALTAVVFASSLSIAFLFLPKEETITALIGDISQLTLPIVLINAILCIAIFFVIKQMQRQLALINISEDLAKVENINVARFNLVYLLCIAVMVALGVRIVGGLLTAALVAIPACSSKNITKTLLSYSFGGLFFGGLASFCGILGFYVTGIAAGPLIIITSGLLFLVSILIKQVKIID